MRKILVIAMLGLIVLLAAAYVLVKEFERDLSGYRHLASPRVTDIHDQAMLVVTAGGDPSQNAGRAIGLLYRACYKMKECVNDAAPRARWPESANAPRAQWTGRFALPLAAASGNIPDITPPRGMKLTVEKWSYGQTAEILHVGPYSKEGPTVEKLKAFIDKNGLEIAGEHEEEYLKGPGMFLKGNPERYMTIIRYPVKKKN